MSKNYLEKLSALNFEQKLHLFEVLAHQLTIAARGAYYKESLSLKEQVDSLITFNECLHRVIARIWAHRLNTHEWKDEDFLKLLTESDSYLHLKLRGSILSAFESSFKVIIN